MRRDEFTPIWMAVVLLVAIVLALAATARGDAGDGTLTGIIVNQRGVPLSDAAVSLGGHTSTTSDDGRFFLGNVGPGLLAVERLAYAPAAITWDGAGDWMTVTLLPHRVNGIHVAGWVAGDDTGWQEMLDIAATTGVNALMIDLKNENGRIYFDDIDVPVAATVGAITAPTAPLAERVADAHARGLYVITRIVSFQDPLVAGRFPSWAVLDAATGQPMVRNGQQFLDPHDPETRQYVLDLADAACAAGVDEVQFDYVRFPDGGQDQLVFDGPVDAATRQATIAAFVAEARTILAAGGCTTAADIFGWITNTPTDGGIGQQFETLAEVADVLSPMIYPSHYSSGWYGFAVPNDHPGPVVTNASQDALDRLGDSQAVLRPWLQDFWYTPDQVRTQIDAMESLELGWMLWNILSEFSVSGIPVHDRATSDVDAPPPTLLDRPASGFFDVSDSHGFAAEIAWLSAAGVSVGCNAPWADLFCPGEGVTRGQMAAFLTRALGLAPPADTDTFSDDDGSGFEADIEAIAAAGITAGCAGDRFCPNDEVTRAQMASFLVRALSFPGGGSSPFDDDDGSVHEANITALATVGVTTGCTPTSYCPGEPVTRAQMAAFLYRALAG